MRTKNWFAVVTAFLAGNSVTNTLPGGDAVGASVQYRMLAGTGIDTVQAAGGLAVSSIIGVGALFALPIFALPIIVGGEAVSAGLVHAGELGAVGFVLIVALGVLVLKQRPDAAHARQSHQLGVLENPRVQGAPGERQ